MHDGIHQLKAQTMSMLRRLPRHSLEVRLAAQIESDENLFNHVSEDILNDLGDTSGKAIEGALDAMDPECIHRMHTLVRTEFLHQEVRLLGSMLQSTQDRWLLVLESSIAQSEPLRFLFETSHWHDEWLSETRRETKRPANKQLFELAQTLAPNLFDKLLHGVIVCGHLFRIDAARLLNDLDQLMNSVTLPPDCDVCLMYRRLEQGTMPQMLPHLFECICRSNDAIRAIINTALDTIHRIRMANAIVRMLRTYPLSTAEWAAFLDEAFVFTANVMGKIRANEDQLMCFRERSEAARDGLADAIAGFLDLRETFELHRELRRIRSRESRRRKRQSSHRTTSRTAESHTKASHSQSDHGLPAKVLNQVRATLTHKQWEVFELRHIEGLKWREIAEIADKSIATCSELFSTGLKRLGATIDRISFEDDAD